MGCAPSSKGTLKKVDDHEFINNNGYSNNMVSEFIRTPEKGLIQNSVSRTGVSDHYSANTKFFVHIYIIIYLSIHYEFF